MTPIDNLNTAISDSLWWHETTLFSDKAQSWISRCCLVTKRLSWVWWCKSCLGVFSSKKCGVRSFPPRPLPPAVEANYRTTTTSRSSSAGGLQLHDTRLENEPLYYSFPFAMPRYCAYGVQLSTPSFMWSVTKPMCVYPIEGDLYPNACWSIALHSKQTCLLQSYYALCDVRISPETEG